MWLLSVWLRYLLSWQSFFLSFSNMDIFWQNYGFCCLTTINKTWLWIWYVLKKGSVKIKFNNTLIFHMYRKVFTKDWLCLCKITGFFETPPKWKFPIWSVPFISLVVLGMYILCVYSMQNGWVIARSVVKKVRFNVVHACGNSFQ